jgi:hypothetical protein
MGKKVIVLLTEAWLDCLKARAGDGSACRVCLDRAIDVRRVFTGSSGLAWSLSCTEEEMREIMGLAARYCPDAAPAIRDSLERFTA